MQLKSVCFMRRGKWINALMIMIKPQSSTLPKHVGLFCRSIESTMAQLTTFIFISQDYAMWGRCWTVPIPDNKTKIFIFPMTSTLVFHCSPEPGLLSVIGFCDAQPRQSPQSSPQRYIVTGKGLGLQDKCTTIWLQTTHPKKTSRRQFSVFGTWNI